MVRCLPLLALVLAACAQAPPPAGAPSGHVAADAGAADPVPASHRLDAWHWRLADAVDAGGSRIEVLFADPDRPLQLDFSHGRVSVAGGCNRIGGGYRRLGTRLRVDRLVQTQVACAQPLMAQDATMVGLLDGALELAIQEADPPRLELATLDGTRLAFTGQPAANAD